MLALTPTQEFMYSCFAIFILLLCVVIIVVGIILIHELPYNIAKRRGHPQQDAIRCMSIMGLFLIPLWFFAMIWAYMKGKTFGAPFENTKVNLTEIIVDSEADKNEVITKLENRAETKKVRHYHRKPKTNNNKQNLVRTDASNRRRPANKPVTKTIKESKQEQKMEILITLAYIFLIWLVHFKFKWMKFGLWYGVFYVFLYGAAVLVDVVVLGQVTPLATEAAVDSVVLQLQPKWSGYIEKIYIESNDPVKKGDPIIAMNPHQWQQRLKRDEAQMTAALKKYKEALQLTPSGAMSQQEVIFRKAEVDKLQAEIELAQFNLKHTITYAPCNGFVPILFLRAGMFIGVLNKNSLPFVCTDDLWMVAKLKQQSVQYVKKGDPCEISLEMYPGKVFRGEVVEMVWAQGNVQFKATSDMAKTTDFRPSEQFFVKVKVTDPDSKRYPLRYGASGRVVVFTKKALDICVIIRRIEMRCDAFLNYIYNPFS